VECPEECPGECLGERPAEGVLVPCIATRVISPHVGGRDGWLLTSGLGRGAARAAAKSEASTVSFMLGGGIKN